MHIYNWYHPHVQTFVMYTIQITIYMAHSPCLPYFPLLIPLAPFAPLYDSPLLTWNPPSCDRIRPPRSRVACKLTPLLSHPSPKPSPSKFPEPKLPSASLRRLQDESGVFCPEQVQWNQNGKISIRVPHWDCHNHHVTPPIFLCTFYRMVTLYT
jgi:hypothetical protein